VSQYEFDLMEIGERPALRICDAKLWARYWEMKR
jgi:hypothetical protein